MAEEILHPWIQAAVERAPVAVDLEGPQWEVMGMLDCVLNSASNLDYHRMSTHMALPVLFLRLNSCSSSSRCRHNNSNSNSNYRNRTMGRTVLAIALVLATATPTPSDNQLQVLDILKHRSRKDRVGVATQ